jgi:hypothetical protein
VKFADKKKQEAHERRLQKRREGYANYKTMQMASRAAEGEADFEELVEAERQRQETAKQSAARKGGAQSPKIMSQAREDLALAFDLMGGVPARVVWGRKNPTDFYRLWAKLIPTNAQENSNALPLETLLEKLASREEQSVGQAAYEIGQELLDAGRKQAQVEDAELIDPSKLN